MNALLTKRKWLTALLVLVAVGCENRNDSVSSQSVTVPSDALGASVIDRPSDQKEDSPEMSDNVTRSEEEWKEILTPDQYHVLREQGTEPPFSHAFDHHFEPGIYSCAACNQELFSSEAKFNSGCGWPAFYAAKAKDRVELTSDQSHGMVRTEVTCARCGSHLGHIFDDAPQTPTGQRYCINGVCLTFRPVDRQDEGSSASPKDSSEP